MKKKLKDKGFAAKVSRDDVYSGVERLGVPLEEHIQLVIDGRRPTPSARDRRGRTSWVPFAGPSEKGPERCRIGGKLVSCRRGVTRFLVVRK